MKRIVFGLLMIATCAAHAVTTSTWNNTTGNWSDGTKWNNGVPGSGDFAVIGGGSVLLSASSAALADLTMTGGTLTFTNWNTSLTAVEVSIGNGATVTLPPAFKNTVMSNNVYFICSNLTIQATGKIDAEARGYFKGVGTNSPYLGHGPGAGELVCGGSYGGRGAEYDLGSRRSGPIYGSESAPLDPGSGGSADNSGGFGGSGGGAVRIAATGRVTVHGTITANGETAGLGGGSGGSVYIDCRTFAGSGGLISAVGGNSVYCPGGGGRVAVVYNSTAQQAESLPSVVLTAGRGTGGTLNLLAAWNMGTVYLPDTALFNPELFRITGQIRVSGLTAWAVDRLVVSNATPRFTNPGFVLTITNDLLVTGSGVLELGGDSTVTNQFAGPGEFVVSGSTGPVLQVGGKLVLTNSGSLVVYAGRTNETTAAYGALVAVTGDVYLATNCWIYPHSQPTNGGSVCFRMASLSIPFTNAGFNADSRGYLKGGKTGRLIGWGPGGGEPVSGGSYGGKGASYFPGYQSGLTYGSVSSPTMPGSGGGGESLLSYGGDGGGAIWLEVAGPVLANGILSANASSGTGGSGSGGGIFISCQTIAGTNGVIRANGARTVSILCPGGGGRIAIQYNASAQQSIPKPRILLSATKGANGDPRYATDNGTIYLTDTNFLDETWMPHTGQFYPMTSWSVSSLNLTNGVIRFGAPGFVLTVTGNLQVSGTNISLALGGDAYTTNKHASPEEIILTSGQGPSLVVNGNVVLTNGGRLIVYAGLTNAPGTNGALVTVKGDVWIHNASWIHPNSNPTNGGSVWFDLANLYIMTTNSGIDADYRGYRKGMDNETKGFGPGGARGNDSGGGYGGTGGWYSVSTRAGLTYGDSNAPAYPGSGGRGEATGIIGGNGGGLIRIKASGTVSVKGRLSARGAAPRAGVYGGGSGGGIYIMCKTFTGDANGSLNANGGNGTETAGGGGRIAVYRVSDTSGGAVPATATQGTGTGNGVAYPGTVVWGWLKGAGTLIVVR